MAKKENIDLTELTYDEFIEQIIANKELAGISEKISENTVQTTPSEKNNENIVVVVRDGSVSDNDAKLSYSNRNQTIYAHALMHMWWNLPEKTKWTRLQVSREHIRAVAKLVSNGWGHMVKDTLDDSLPQSLCQDFAPSIGEDIVKPMKIVLVTNDKREEIKDSELMR